MFKIRYLIETLSPVIISDDSADENLIPAKDYITGSSIRGFFAGVYQRKRSLESPAYNDENFKRLFLDDELIFTNAYLAEKYENEILASQILPFFIQNIKNTEKYTNLFVEDINEPTKLKKIFYISKNNQFKTLETKKRIFFHNAIDYKTGTTKDGFIFNYEAIEPEQIFYGEILGEEKDLRDLIDFLGEKEFTGRIGKSRNTQYGSIKITLISDKPEFFNTEISLNNKLALICHSDLILTNEYGYYITTIKELEKYLSEISGNEELKIEKAFFRVVEIEGFVSVWKARRQRYLAFEKGSSFLISNISKEKIDKLKDICEKGLGLLTGEGFGRIAILSPEKIVPPKFVKDLEKPIKKPTFISDKNKKILLSIYYLNQERWLKTSAIEDSHKFKLIPSSSLLSRIETMLNKSDSFETFQEKVNTLRKKATDDLEKCNNGKLTLLSILKEDPKISAIDSLLNNIEGLKKEIGLKEIDSIDYFSLYKIYLATLLYSLRKLNKEKK